MNNALPCLCTRESRETQAGEVRTRSRPGGGEQGLTICLVFSVTPKDNANQAVPSLNNPFNSGAVSMDTPPGVNLINCVIMQLIS